MVDVSNPAQPREVGFYDTPGRAEGVAVSGAYAYVADAGRGLRVVDVSNPAQPREVGSYDTPGWAEGVAVSGAYAYVADGEAGLRVVDVSNPAQPREVGFYDTPGWAEGVAVSGAYAYVADGDYGGLRVVDVSNPAQPREVGFYDTPGYAEGVAVSGAYAYVADGYYGGLRVVDVSNPAQPREVGFYDTPGYAEGVAVSGAYAYVADWDAGLRVVDVSNPAQPREVGFYDTPRWARGVAVAGAYAYVADGPSGLRVIDVSNPAAPREVGFYDTPGEARGVAVSGAYAYVADGPSGLRVIDVSNPAAPRQVGVYDTPGRAEGVAVSGAYAYVADAWSGLRVVDVSNPAQPREVGFYDTLGYAEGVAVSGAYAYVADGGGGLVILRFTGAGTYSISGRVADSSGNPISGVTVSDNAGHTTTGSDGRYTLSGLAAGTYTITPSKSGYAFSPASRQVTVPPDATGVDFQGSLTITVVPVWPSTHTTPSKVMQGGTAYRHFRLLDSGGNPIPNATVAFSTGGPATTDAQGYFTYTVQADALGGPGSYPVSVQSVTYGGQTYSTNNQPTFSVEVTERRYAHSWSYGAVRTASAGLSTGLIAYLSVENNGGLGLTLEESNPNRTDDDTVNMEENYSLETSAGVGVGVRERVRAGVVKANLDSSVTSEASLRFFGSLEAEFDHPYADSDRKAQGIFLTLSVLDSAVGVRIQPLVVSMLRAAESRLSYLDYIAAQSAGMAAKVTPLRANVGAEVGLAASRSGSRRKEGTVGFTLLDVGASRLVVAVLTDYGDEYSIGFEDELSVDMTLLSPDLPWIKNRLIGLLGNSSRRLHKEYFFDSATDRLKRIELTLSSEGNPNVFTDVVKKQVSVRLVLEGANLIPSLVERVGQAQAISDLNDLLKAVPEIPYSVEVEDGSSISFVPELSIPGTEIRVGFGLEVEKTRNLVRERGVFLNGKPYVTETYNADAYVSRPGKSWWDLTTNALGGLWLLVRDAFNWTWQRVQSGVGWVIGTVSRTVSGVIRGGAQIIAPPGTQLYARGFGAQGIAIQQTEPITVTAIGWVPESTAGTGALALRPALAAASGAGFVVGGIYEFQPYTLTLSPAATLVITYTDEAAAGVDESRLGMFRWNMEGNNWQPMAASCDPAQNQCTASITQLGTFALGYDATPPQITFLEPTDGSTISNTLPLISALVVDVGVGINPTTVQMRLDGQVVAATYITGTGELVYLPPAPLAMGQHTVLVSAQDVLGNQASATATFTVRPEYKVYLPLVLRNR